MVQVTERNILVRSRRRRVVRVGMDASSCRVLDMDHDDEAQWSPVEIENGMKPRSPVSTSHGLARMRREAVERDTLEHMRELSTLRDEGADAAELAAEHYNVHVYGI